MTAEQTTRRIAYLRKAIDRHERTRDREIALGVNAEWIDNQNAANVRELAALTATPEPAPEPEPMSPRMAAMVRAEEARIRRIARSYQRRGIDIF